MVGRTKRKRYSWQGAGMLFVLMLLPCLQSQVFTQISHGGMPAAGILKSSSAVPVVSMPEFDADSYLSAGHPDENSRLKPLTFAKSFDVNINPEESGIWEIMPDGRNVWRIALESRGAYSLNIIFGKYRLEKGVSVFAYTPSLSHVLGAFNYRNNQGSGALAISPLAGDRIIVEMQMEKGVEHWGQLMIETLNHDFIGILDNKSSRYGFSGKCNIDINCPVGEKWQTHKHSVARLITDGNQLCSGIFVNNTGNDGTPYLLTANHCVGDSTNAARTVFLLGYESPFCNGGDGKLDKTLSGAALLATQENLDFTLLRVAEEPPQSYYVWYAGWNRTQSAPSNTVSIHHPGGDVKKIAIDHDAPATATFGSGYTPDGHWHIEQWDLGTTEGGSSGSPLFDHDGYLVGLLTGGDGRCGDAVNDFYCKFSLAWDNYEGSENQLQPWLDPEGTGDIAIGGYDPWSDSTLAARFAVSTVEICQGDKVVFTDFSTGNPDSWYWDFGTGASPRTAITRGPHSVSYSQSGKRNISLAISSEEGSDTRQIQFELTVKATEIPVSSFLYKHDDLVVEFTDLSDHAVSYYWEFGDGRISTLSNPVHSYIAGGQYKVSQVVRNRACSDTSQQVILLEPNLVLPGDSQSNLKIYPVPANSFFIIEPGSISDNDIIASVYTSGGMLLKKREFKAGTGRIVINVENWPAGTYILKISSGNEHFTTKIPVIR